MTAESTDSSAREIPGGRPLGSAIRRVASASAVAMVVGEVVSFVQTIALARLLTPAQVGAFVAGTVLTTFLGNFVEGGLRSALIQRSADVEDAAETVFRATLVAGVAMAGGALAVAPLIGRIFDDRTVGLVAAVTSGLLLIHALTNVPEGLLQRAFSVRRRLVVGPLVAVTYAAVAVSLAAAGWGLWAMVAGMYASQLAGLIALWTITDWRPGRGRASVKTWRELARFGFPLVAGMVGARARTAAEALVVGRGLSSAALGNFRYGQRIARIPTAAFIEIGSNSLFPAFARISAQPDRMRTAYVRALHWAMIPSAAVAGLLFVVGEPSVVVLFGPAWRDAGRAVTAMSALGIGYAMTTVSEEVIKGSDRTRLLNWLTAADLLVGTGVLLALTAWSGLPGAAASLSVVSLTIGLGMLLLARQVVPVPVRMLAGALGTPIPALAVATPLTWVLERHVIHADQRSLPVAVAGLALDALVYGVSYLAVLAVFARQSAAVVVRAAGQAAGRLRRARGGA